MTDIYVGELYCRARLQRGTSVPTGQTVKVMRKEITRHGYGSRKDGIEVAPMTEVEEGVYNYRHVDSLTNKPETYIITAREIMTVEEVARQREEKRKAEEERQRRNKLREDFTTNLQKLVAMRLGISGEYVSASAMWENDTSDVLVPWRANVDNDGLKAMLESDPDPEIIAGALDEIEYSKMTAAQIAEHIVGALRGTPDEEDDDEDA
jgi:hypothetical protein